MLNIIYLFEALKNGIALEMWKIISAKLQKFNSFIQFKIKF